MPDRTPGLAAAARHARAFLSAVDERPVASMVDASCVRKALGGPVPELHIDGAFGLWAAAAGHPTPDTRFRAGALLGR
jgi:hypothetical protein